MADYIGIIIWLALYPIFRTADYLLNKISPVKGEKMNWKEEFVVFGIWCILGLIFYKFS